MVPAKAATVMFSDKAVWFRPMHAVSRMTLVCDLMRFSLVEPTASCHAGKEPQSRAQRAGLPQILHGPLSQIVLR
ncbi:MAG: hypothetical protein Kilf2KO_48810 [Rhodospirillales bacterium]